jgi:hypothetical protein
VTRIICRGPHGRAAHRAGRALAAGLISCAALLLFAPRLRAQSRGHFTFGVQGTSVWAGMPSFNFSNIPTTVESCRCAYFGWGLRLTVRVLGPLGLDAEWDDMPGQGQLQTGFHQVFIGPRLRALSLGPLHLLLYARPGIVFAKPGSLPPSPGGTGFGGSGAQNHFALDGGGSLELDASRHWLVRLDLGDVWVSNAQSTRDLASAGFFANNPQASLGFAYRF